MLSLDADWLGAGPSQIANARGFAEARKDTSAPARFQRLYVVEPAWTATGANADHRLALRPELIGNVAIAVAARLRKDTPQRPAAGDGAKFAHIAAARSHITARPRAGAGRDRHSRRKSMRSATGSTTRSSAPVDLIEPVDPGLAHAESLQRACDRHRDRHMPRPLIFSAAIRLTTRPAN